LVTLMLGSVVGMYSKSPFVQRGHELAAELHEGPAWRRINNSATMSTGQRNRIASEKNGL